MLRDEDLVRLEAVWRAQGAPIADSLAPGLSGDDLAELEAEHGLVVPAELRLWWGWHDGVVGGGRRGGSLSAIGAGPWHFLSLGEALDVRRFHIALDPSPFPESVDDWNGEWASWWLPVFKAGSACCFADLSTATDSGVSIHLWAQQPDDPFTPMFASFGEMVEASADGIERGYFTWRRDLREWEISDALSADAMRLL
ncbi:SMI1/KNR4 family protein [Actinoplanes sp. NEAU-A12]|uniref:SMI1/KNR4 family protein n=1 Tax=Actinoplanes sandaracinus TaxID=3045177 RepID=A0ABT6X1S3_9ACTN|nr:SMI1/KNR4 family protein [Actinoplanes sandaracinus]MDI6105955.1 SMI1/KNR4 family protein [Actinoplanes sandaracinus]